MGWVKQKLSPEEEARSAARASRLRPIQSDTAPAPPPADASGYQTVALMAPAQSQMAPPPPASMPAPELNPYLSTSPAMAAPPVVPSRPISRDQAVAADGVPPFSQPMPPAPPPRPAAEPTIGRSAPPPPPEPARAESRPPSGFTGQRTVEELRRRAEYLSRQGLTYKFGGDHPSEGGMDCSGTMQFLLQSMGYPDIPRTSYDQFAWLGEQGTLKKIGVFHSAERAVNNLRPGDLVFWGGTYNSGHKVSHVMVYLGKSRGGTHYLFGARGKKVKGLNGAGVDIFEYHPGKDTDRLVGYGRLPGIKGT